ncbi:HTH-type transcriptional regulator GltC [BD1-7 clade bacterium]|uniref:HTH-type transcriptional regulator GltC n=1 Tax=BD1-7 clade bacterium TaxID=2029982 RepID=A0A5S9QZB2_9GAMM|nr:HTH-type transcriptional regulator GltC [BD1-7 clade bacterium]
MDLDLFSTFIEVSKTRHFGKAADNLYLTQSAVSARIRLLESNVNTRLFERNTKQVNLTEHGVKLLQHAEVILRAWDNAKLDLMNDNETREKLSIASTPGLWHYIFNQKIVDLLVPEEIDTHATDQQTADRLINTLSLAEEDIRRSMIEEALDLALVYDNINDPDIGYQQIGSMNLRLMVHQRHESCFQLKSTPYIHVNWGHSFNLFHHKQFGDTLNLTLQTDNAQTAQHSLLSTGGCAYLPDILLDESNEFVGIDNKIAPTYKRKVYACYRRQSTRKTAIETLIRKLSF